MQNAGFGARLIALIVDWIALMLIGAAILMVWTAFAAGASVTESRALDFLQAGVGIVAYIAILCSNFLYFGFLWSRDGQSVGMKILGIKVVRRGGEPMSFLRSGFRGTLGYYISGFVFCIGFLWAAFDANQETWHDKIFETTVVRA